MSIEITNEKINFDKKIDGMLLVNNLRHNEPPIR